MSPIASILNCYAPATGHNIAQIAIRSDGTVKVFGDKTAAHVELRKLRDKLGELEEITAPVPGGPRRKMGAE
jgi:hypothetical protein